MTNTIINKESFKFTDAYKGSLQNLDWLKTNTIFLTLHGSHAYGTNIATSDIDYRGFCVSPKKYYLGYRNEYKNYVQNEPDLTIFECKKFFNLCLKANPNALEILFTDPKDHLIVHPAVEKILANKSMFLSKKAKHTFSGYAFGQLKRIHLHYSWITNQPTRPPTRADVGLPEKSEVPQDKILSAMAAVKKQMDIWNWHELDGVEPSIRQAIKDEFQTMLTEITQWPWQELEDRTWLAACNQIGFSTNVIELLAKERKLAAKQQEWKDFLKWKAERNPTRHALEAKYGYDTKHGMHLVRLMNVCTELLTTGKMNVFRPDAALLLEIRNGKYTYHELIDWFTNKEKELQEIYKTCTILPDEPNHELAEEICIETIERIINHA